jgi:putative peptidoglycan lipid II flippase
LYNVVLCGLLVFARKYITVPAFAVVMTVAWILQLAMILPYIIKEKYKFRLRFNLKAPELRTYFKTALVTAFTTTAFLICYLIDTRQSAYLGTGVTSAFYYADKLFTPVTTTLIYSIGAVIFPKWSELYATMKEKDYRRYVGNVVENTMVILLPLSVIFASFGQPIVRVLFEGESFDAAASILTGSIFAKYMLGMLGFALLDLLAKAYYAMGKTKNPLIINVAVIALNALLNFVILRFFPSASAVSVITSVCMTIGGIVLTLMFFGGKLRGIFNAVRIIKTVILSALIYVSLYFVTPFFVNADDGKIMLVLKCGLLGVVALGIYLVFMRKSLIVKLSNETEEQQND